MLLSPSYGAIPLPGPLYPENQWDELRKGRKAVAFDTAEAGKKTEIDCR
jgi:hypothetical protein